MSAVFFGLFVAYMINSCRGLNVFYADIKKDRQPSDKGYNRPDVRTPSAEFFLETEILLKRPLSYHQCLSVQIACPNPAMTITRPCVHKRNNVYPPPSPFHPMSANSSHGDTNTRDNPDGPWHRRDVCNRRTIGYGQLGSDRTRTFRVSWFRVTDRARY